jgi:beta-mannosidase
VNKVLLFCLLWINVNAQNVADPFFHWQFRKEGDTTWHVAALLSTVYFDLRHNKLIDDPYFGSSEKELQWVDTCVWEYQSVFDVSKEQFDKSHVELIFEGLDTYADVFLNDLLILSAENI